MSHPNGCPWVFRVGAGRPTLPLPATTRPEATRGLQAADHLGWWRSDVTDRHDLLKEFDATRDEARYCALPPDAARWQTLVASVRSTWEARRPSRRPAGWRKAPTTTNS